jgi:hypothetical protein
VPSPVTLPTLRLADSRLVVIIEFVMSVVTSIGATPLGSSLKAISKALAGVATKQIPTNAVGMNTCFMFMDWMNDWSVMIFLRRLYRKIVSVSYRKIVAVSSSVAW